MPARDERRERRHAERDRPDDDGDAGDVDGAQAGDAPAAAAGDGREVGRQHHARAAGREEGDEPGGEGRCRRARKEGFTHAAKLLAEPLLRQPAVGEQPPVFDERRQESKRDPPLRERLRLSALDIDRPKGEGDVVADTVEHVLRVLAEVAVARGDEGEVVHAESVGNPCEEAVKPMRRSGSSTDPSVSDSPMRSLHPIFTMVAESDAHGAEQEDRRHRRRAVRAGGRARVPREGRLPRLRRRQRAGRARARRADEARPRRARPHAPRHRGRGDLPRDPQPFRRADPHAHREVGRGRACQRARDRRRRLPDEAVQPARARRPRARDPATHAGRRDAARGDALVRRRPIRDRHGRGTKCASRGRPST